MVGISVGVGICVGVLVDVGTRVEVGTEVDVGMGATVGPNACPGPQPEKSRLITNTHIASAFLLVFIYPPALSRAFPAPTKVRANR